MGLKGNSHALQYSISKRLKKPKKQKTFRTELFIVIKG